MAIPNGGKRSRTEAAIMKAEGVYAGAADLFIPLCNGKWYGLFIEMKSKTGRLTDNQMAFRDKVLYNRYSYVVCRDLDEFVIKINDYMSLVT